jgi:hypothetical protein
MGDARPGRYLRTFLSLLSSVFRPQRLLKLDRGAVLQILQVPTTCVVLPEILAQIARTYMYTWPQFAVVFSFVSNGWRLLSYRPPNGPSHHNFR